MASSSTGTSQTRLRIAVVPVFTYYMLLQSSPAAGADEAARDLSNLRNAATMKAYWADVRAFFQHANATTPVVLHVEPDLWGYIEQAAPGDSGSTVPASVASSGFADVGGIANDATGFAKAFVHLRNLYAPNVILAYHLSGWGTKVDLHANAPTDAQTDALAARAATFYASLGAAFDVAFADIADRDAGFRRVISGDGGAAWWSAPDFARWGRFIGGFVATSGRRVVVWQIPLGNTTMRALDDTWAHFQDNRVEWFLDDSADGHLAAWRDAGVIALLYGGGADGTTCACDAAQDGVTNPPAINGNTRLSLSADDDGGYFRDRAGAFYRLGGLSLEPAAPPPGATPSPTPTPGRDPDTRGDPAANARSAAGRDPDPDAVANAALDGVGPPVGHDRPPTALPHDHDEGRRVAGHPGPGRRRDLRPARRAGRPALVGPDRLPGRNRPRVRLEMVGRIHSAAGQVHRQGRDLPARLERPPYLAEPRPDRHHRAVAQPARPGP